MKISAALSFFGDFDHLEDCLGRIAPHVDQIVLLDGAFAYARPLLEALGLDGEAEDPRLHPLIERFAIKYERGHFADEAEKRIRLYELCDGDLVLLVDADEVLVDWSPAALRAFVASQAVAAPCLLHNQCRGGLQIGAPGLKYVLFKKRDVSARDHLNYTWLVGVEQRVPDPARLARRAVGRMLHYTLRRSLQGNIVKYAFYVSLWKHRNAPGGLERVGDLSLTDAGRLAGGAAGLRDLFGHSMPEMANMYTGAEPLSRTLVAGDDGARRAEAGNRRLLRDGGGLRLLAGLPAVAELDLPRYKRAGAEIRLAIEGPEAGHLQARAFLRALGRTYWLPVDLAVVTVAAGRREYEGRFTLPCDAAHLVFCALEFQAAGVPGGIAELSGFALKRSLLIYGNCQSEAIAACLTADPAFRRRWWWIPTPGRLVHMMAPADVDALQALLPDVDGFVLQQVDDDYRGDARFGTARLVADIGPGRPIVLFPNLFFDAYNKGVHVVRRRDGAILERPMPIHDVGLIHLLLRHRLDREAARAAYRAFVEDENDPVGRGAIGDAAASLAELRRRVSRLRERFGHLPDVAVLDYAEILEAIHDRRVAHYSDAHPTEASFAAVCAALAPALDLGAAPRDFTLAERGALPVPRAVRAALGIGGDDPPLYINNEAVDLGTLITRYLDAYAGLSGEDLHRYISRSVTRFVVCNHRAGTDLVSRVLRRHAERTGERLLVLEGDPATASIDGFAIVLVTHAQIYAALVAARPALRCRTVHLHLDAISTIAAGAHYHSLADDAWLRAPVFEPRPEAPWGVRLSGHFGRAESQKPHFLSYRQVIAALGVKDRLLFEIDMLGSTFDTLAETACLLERGADDGNILALRFDGTAFDAQLPLLFDFLDLDPRSLDECREVARWWQAKLAEAVPPSGIADHVAAFDADCHRRLMDRHGTAIGPVARSHLFPPGGTG